MLAPSSPGQGNAGKNSMSELKLRRLTEHNAKLQEDLARPRIRVSEASQSLMKYVQDTNDHLVPSVWGPVSKSEDPFSPSKGGTRGNGGGGSLAGCCSLM